MKRKVTVSVALAVVIALAPAVLRAEKIPIDYYIVACNVEAGNQFLTNDGRVLHVVGEVEKGFYYDVGSFEVKGEYVAVVNVRVKLATERLRLCGTVSGLLEEYSPTNTFDATWNAKFGAAGFTGRVLGHGTFGLRDDKVKLSLSGIHPEEIPDGMQQILAESPWTECDRISGPNRVTGFVRLAAKE